MTITLTSDQETAFAQIKKFLLDSPDDPAIVITGSAGVGKTTLTKYIADYITNEHKLPLVAVAPTHKARRVLDKNLNHNRLIEIPSLTVASLLGKLREHSYIGTHTYTNGNKEKMAMYDFFIIDEVSMIPDKDLEEIIDYICEHDKKLILIGDKCQIPAPNQKLILKNNMCYKPDSDAFNIANTCELTEIVRQKSESPIITIATYLRDHLDTHETINTLLDNCSISSNDICISTNDLYQLFSNDWNNGLDTRIIAYTNATVRFHNKKIRYRIGHTESIVVGELLTGYNNIGWPRPTIENGSDYKVTSVQYTTKYQILNFSQLVGNIIDLSNLDDPKEISLGLFCIDIQHSANLTFMNELLHRADKVNKRYSTKNEYKSYCALKNKAVFLEDVYKYNRQVMTYDKLREVHPLLFTKVSEVIDVQSKNILKSKLSEKLEDQYGEIIEGRLIDNKPFTDGEVFADQYMMIEKDIYYGYSITGHKSQGSTYDSVYVDEHDLNKIVNKWNYRYKCIEERQRERNQLKYVSYTRPRQKLRIIYT